MMLIVTVTVRLHTDVELEVLISLLLLFSCPNLNRTNSVAFPDINLLQLLPFHRNQRIRLNPRLIITNPKFPIRILPPNPTLSVLCHSIPILTTYTNTEKPLSQSSELTGHRITLFIVLSPDVQSSVGCDSHEVVCSCDGC